MKRYLSGLFTVLALCAFTANCGSEPAPDRFGSEASETLGTDQSALELGPHIASFVGNDIVIHEDNLRHTTLDGKPIVAFAVVQHNGHHVFRRIVQHDGHQSAQYALLQQQGQQLYAAKDFLCTVFGINCDDPTIPPIRPSDVIDCGWCDIGGACEYCDVDEDNAQGPDGLCACPAVGGSCNDVEIEDVGWEWF